MRKFVPLLLLLGAMALPAFCQNGQLSPEDQRDFDKAYSKWVNDSRKNDRDDVQRDERRMQDIMARNNIASDTPYDRVATGGSAQDNGYPQNQDNGYGQSSGSYAQPQQSSRLSADDQREFDHYYDKWVKDSHKNDRDDVERDERHMRDIMARYNIPNDVPYDQIASNGSQGGYDSQGGYNNAPPQNYPPSAPPQSAPPAYPQDAPNQGYSNGSRLSPDDQREFDQHYSRWVDDSRRNDRDDEAREMHRMREIMSRNNIPPDVPVDQVASPGASRGYSGNTGGYNNGYNGGQGAYNGSYNNGYNGGYGNGQNRLSPDDQHEFDRAYAKWVRDQRHHDRDDLARDERRMQDIMARYSIPSNTPYDQVASPNAPLGERH